MPNRFPILDFSFIFIAQYLFMSDLIQQKAASWLSAPYDEATQEEVQQLIRSHTDELTDAFYRDLEFGTGGLRGIMGAGTNRINIYTIGMATQGLSNYLNRCYPGQNIRVAIAHDSRNNSRLFAENVADVFASNGLDVFLFEDLRPTPELSFAIRHLKCQAGVVVTASHNPKEYNGYKVYWNDGGQLVAPHDKNVITEVQAISGYDAVKRNNAANRIHPIGNDLDQAYLEKVNQLLLSPEAVASDGDLKIVYTNLHGTGGTLIPKALKKAGFRSVYTVEEQDGADGNFPTVESPNPEEPAALDLALKKAKRIGADMVMGTDPDTDRIGIAVRNGSDRLVLLNGNQTASLLVRYILQRHTEKGTMPDRPFLGKTIVTTELINKIAEHFEVPVHTTLTGFKYIAELIREKETEGNFVVGGEESYGYLIGDFVRDKDAVSSAVMIAEMAVWLKSRQMSVYEFLIDTWRKFGFYQERLLSITKKGRSGLEAIASMMRSMRENPPKALAGIRISEIADYQSGIISPGQKTTGLPVSNVLQFFLEDGSKVTARPSGTEPKIKFYISIKGPLTEEDTIEKAIAAMQMKMDALLKDLLPEQN